MSLSSFSSLSLVLWAPGRDEGQGRKRRKGQKGPQRDSQGRRRRVPLRLATLIRELRRALNGCQTVLDVGCGTDSPSQYLADDLHIEGLDIHEPSLNAAEAKSFLKARHLGGAMDLDDLFPPNTFDAVIALDVIEHLAKKDGLALIEKMKRAAKRRIVLFTPNGFLPQPADDNPWQEHKSGWTTEDFRARGFTVVGVNGPRALRGEYARIRWRPRLVWAAASELLQRLWTRDRPEGAFALFCVLDLDR